MLNEPRDPIGPRVRKYLKTLKPLSVITLKQLYGQFAQGERSAVRAALYACTLGTPVADKARPRDYYAIRLVLPIHPTDPGQHILLSLPGLPRKHIEYDAAQANTRAVVAALSRDYSQEVVNYWFRSAQYRSVDLIRASMRQARERTGGRCALCLKVNELRQNRDLDPVPETSPTQACHVISRNSVFWKHLAEAAAQLGPKVFSAEGVETLKSSLINDPLHSSSAFMIALCRTHDRLLQDALRLHGSRTSNDQTQLPLL